MGGSDYMNELKVLDKWPVTLFLVGGSVRDELLGIPSKDKDVCSSLLPNEVLEWCSSHNMRAEVTNASHLVVSMFIGNECVEHTTFRRESECDGVKAGLVEPSTQEEDAFRRDLSINALYKEWGSDKVIDFVGGLEDLKNKTLRLISSPTYGNEFSRLWEHGGRLFRLARFASTKFKGWKIDSKTRDACRNFSPLIFMESRGKRESFGEEWSKANYSLDYLVELKSLGFFIAHNLYIPSPSEWYPNYPWYSLWLSSDRPNIKTFQSDWKLPNEEVLIIQDLELGKDIKEEYEWRTTKFRRLSPSTVAAFWNTSFRNLDIPTQGEVALEVGEGPQVLREWRERVKNIYDK